jgi:gliding motility-associated-like protein
VGHNAIKKKRNYNVKMKLISISIIFLLSSVLFSQTLFYQDICKCGVIGTGFSGGMGFGKRTISINIEPGSVIKKAYLFAHEFGLAPNTIIKLNSNPLEFNSGTRISNIVLTAYPGAENNENSVHSRDVTSLIQPNIINYTIEIVQPTLFSCTGCSFGNIYLLIIYENNSFTSNISTYSYINNKNLTDYIEYSSDKLNLVSNGNPLGFAIYTDRIGDSLSNDRSIIYLKNIKIGSFGGSDPIPNPNNGAGVQGHFTYKDGVLSGLDDDTPDTLISGTDGLMNASHFLNTDNTLKWRLDWEKPTSGDRYNIYSGFFITHATPCQPINAVVPEEVETCLGVPVQLNASGGTSYEWKGGSGLSCMDCPNPVFTGDSTRIFRLTIGDGSGCTVVRPVRVLINPLPEFKSLKADGSLCGTETGKLTMYAKADTEVPYGFSLNGGVWQNGIFKDLAAGSYTLTLTDGKGCTRDTVMQVGSYNNTVAAFSATPSSGAVPYTVSLNNQSKNADQYEWYLDDNFMGSDFQQFTCEESGSYTITLIAWQYDPSCADTARHTVIAYDSLIVQFPNILTANGDGVNDYFGLTCNTKCKVSVVIVNRYGGPVYNFEGELIEGFNPMWDGKFKGEYCTEGTYFYKINLQAWNPSKTDPTQGEWNTEVDVKSGFVVLEK